MSRQDRQGVRRPAEVERKYNFPKRFDEQREYTDKTVDESVKSFNDKLDQREIFNRLTNDGESQGVYMDENGQIFINASYLATGILQSLDGSTFYLDLVNGVLKGRFEEFSIAGKTVEEIANEKSNTAQGNAEKYADTAAEKAVNAQTQTDVFNKLTDNGKAQGIYFTNGQLYINASYLAAGILKSKNGSTFNLDIANNTLKIAGKKVKWKEIDGDYVLVGE